MRRVANRRPSYSMQIFFQGQLLLHKAWSRFKAVFYLRNFLMAPRFLQFFCCFYPLRCSTPTLNVRWWANVPPHLRLEIFWLYFTSLWMYLNNFVQPWTHWIADAKCQQCHPTWLLRQQKEKKRGLFQFSCVLGECKLIKLQHSLAITSADLYHWGVLLSNCQPF